MGGRAWGVLLKAADEWSQPGSPDTDRVGPRLGSHRDRPTQPRMIERLVGRQPRMIKRLVLPGSEIIVHVGGWGGAASWRLC